MSTTGHDADEARRQAVERVAQLLAEARSRGLAGSLADGPLGAAFADVVGEVGRLDRDLQRRIARAVVASRGDPEAVRAVLEAPRRPAPAVAESAVASTLKASKRTPTVVDARSGGSWGLALGVAIAAAAAAAVLLAGRG